MKNAHALAPLLLITLLIVSGCIRQPACDNGVCEQGETPASCPADCRKDPVCGDGFCEGRETTQTCPQDCRQTEPVCGNGECEPGESASSCPRDCPGAAKCGNGVCDVGETNQACPQDCPPSSCGNGQCESGETSASCPADCKPVSAQPACKFPSFTLYNVGKPLLTTTGDPLAFADPSVLLDQEDQTYKMWVTTGTAQVTGTGYLESADGITWQVIRGPSNLAILPTPGGWDKAGVETVSVLKKDGRYLMWHTGYPDKGNRVVSVGYATSPDGISWTKHPTPVLKAEAPWEQTWTRTISDDGNQTTTTYTRGGPDETTVVFNGTTYLMWYANSGFVNNVWGYRIGQAESSDGVTWTKSAKNPIFTPGPKGSWDSGVVGHPMVMPDPVKGYHLFYHGGTSTADGVIGHAYSPDGITWERDPNNPIITLGTQTTSNGETSIIRTGGPTALYKDGKILLYFMSANPTFTQSIIHLAIAPCP